VPPLTIAQIEAVLTQFRGDILQLPPVYSALKQDGESLHRKARRGETVTVQPRPITIRTLELVDFHAPDHLCLRVISSAGTYIRSLAHDLGHALGCCAHLSLLRREAAGQFTLAQSITLPEIEAAAEAQTLEELLLPAGANLVMPEVIVDREAAIRLSQGQKVYLPASATGSITDTVDSQADDEAPCLAKIVDEDTRFLGIGRCLKQNRMSIVDPLSIGANQGGTLWKAEKWLASADEIR
jgi:tRNA pseudouridine55 synthase